MISGIVIGVAITEAVLLCAALYFVLSKNSGAASDGVSALTQEVEQREALLEEVSPILEQLVDLEQIREKGRDLIEIIEALKAERGRNTITQAELETVETRMRELEEIERELEASSIETKEELKILNKKQKDLSGKNETLKAEIAASVAKMQALMQEMELSAEISAQLDIMKTQLISTEQKIDALLLEIEQGNDQYFILKQRYDALDIEYAQLFEKFSEAEAQMNAGKN